MESIEQTPDQLPPRAAARLEQIIASKKAICFERQVPNKEYRYIKYSAYGAVETNELFVKLESGSLSFVEAVSSALFHPPMADRIFGMDVLDEHRALDLAEKMWAQHSQALIGPPSPQR